MSTSIQFERLQQYPTLQEKEIIGSAHNISEHLLGQGFPVHAYTENSLNQFLSLNDEKKLEVKRRLNIMSQLLVGDLEIERDPNQHPERHLVEKALRFYKLKLKDDYWAKVELDDIIEVYNEESFQIFRTFNFFNTCGYSLMDLLNNEWYVLWERPKFVLQRLLTYANEVNTGARLGISKMEVPQHIVKESCSGDPHGMGFTPRSALVEFGYIAPLYHEGDSNTIGGFIISSKAKLITVGEDDTNKVSIL